MDSFKEFKIKSKIVNRQVDVYLDYLCFPESTIKWIFNYYKVDTEASLKIFTRIFYKINSFPEVIRQYPECCRAMQYYFRLENIIQTEQNDDYISRFDIIQDLDFDQEVREYIINTHRKCGYPYGLRIRRLDGGYAIYWDKIQINGKCFLDFGFNYFEELISNGKEKTEEKIKRLFR